MTRGPRRLKDDSDFQWETGCNLEDEKLVVGDYDLAGMRSRIVAGVLATGVAASTAVIIGDGVPVVARAAGWSFATVVKPVLGAAGGAAVLAGAYWLGVQSRSPETLPEPEIAAIHGPASPGHGPASPGHGPASPGYTPPEMPAPAALSTGPLVPGRTVEPIGERPADAGVATEDSVPVASAPLRTTPEESAPAEVEPAGTASEQPLSWERPGIVPPASDVPAQKTMLYAADDAMGRGDYADAAQLYTDLIHKWPNGVLWVEAELGLLNARSLGQDYVGTARLAEQIYDDPAFSDKRQEILRLWAESLVQLDRCTEALRLAEELSVRSAAPTRKSCRGVRREGD
jgi:hypothetical protein